MRKGIKYLISVGFLLYGVYKAVIYGIMLCYVLMTLFTALGSIIKSGYLLSVIFAFGLVIMLTLLMIISAVMHICISLKRKNWKYILKSGLLELSAYVLICISTLYMQISQHNLGFNVEYYQRVLKFAIIPLCIVGFALYSRKHENSYEPLPILLARWRGQTE